MSDPQDESNDKGDEPATESIPEQKQPASTTAKAEVTRPKPPTAPASEKAKTPPAPPVKTAETAVPPPPSPQETDMPAEAATTAIPRVAPAVAAPKPPVGPRRIPPRAEVSQPQARPQRIEPAQGAPATASTKRSASKRWMAALVGALVLIVVVGILGFVYLSRDTEDTTPDAQIRTSVQSFTQALASGDLATLRAGSCGDLAAYYRDIPDAEFADVHRIAVEQGNVPVVENVDAVQVTGDTAIAQVIAYTAANPSDKSPRTFDLRLEGDVWKVC